MSVLNLLLRLEITWVQQRQYHRAHGSARERVLSLALSTWRRDATASLDSVNDVTHQEFSRGIAEEWKESRSENKKNNLTLLIR